MQNILLVEDDPYVGQLLERALASAGYRVSKVTTAAAAHLLLDQRLHDLVLTDSGLPDGSGVTVADRARDLGIKTLILSGHAPPASPDQHEYVVKPIPPSALLAIIKRVLEA